MDILNKDQIIKMNYPDFIGAMGIENTSLLGSFAVDYWISKSNINKESKILELACSTGFNLRTCVLKTQSTGIGIDISKSSIESATDKMKKEGLDSKVQFQVEKAENLSFPDNSFTHVISGLSFAFIKHRDKALNEVIRILHSEGYLLTSVLYYKDQPSVNLLDKVEAAFGFRPCDSWNYNWWKKFFSKSFVLKNEISVINTKFLNNYSSSKQISDYVFHENPRLKKCTKEIKEVCAERLLKIHETIAENSKYQIGKLQVWRLKPSLY